MRIRSLFILISVAAVMAVPAAAQLQECPGTTGTSFCNDQYNNCWADNEGKNCDAHSCPQYCSDQYDACMYGHVAESTTYPWLSRTSIPNGYNGCVQACTVEGGNAFPWLCIGNFWAARMYDTHYQEVYLRVRVCDDGYQYTEYTNVVDHPSRTCYERDDTCPYLDGPSEYVAGGGCFFNVDGSNTVRFQP